MSCMIGEPTKVPFGLSNSYWPQRGLHISTVSEDQKIEAKSTKSGLGYFIEVLAW